MGLFKFCYIYVFEKLKFLGRPENWKTFSPNDSSPVL